VTAKFLLDTDVISEPLKANPNRGIMRHLEKHQTELAISSIVWHELLVGCYRLPPSHKRSAIEKFLNALALPILPYDADAGKWHAAERARLMGLGKTPPFIDGQIAAVAYTRDLVLVTSNVADFAFFEGLNLVDWQKKN
jgi:tRNA(fMet)-specific endonuclease VapC